jgi:hypothetical protein
VNEILEKIIQLIDKHVSDFSHEYPSNSGDTNLATRISSGFQLVFGVCNSDPMELDVQHYKRYIIDELRGTNFSPSFLSFPYTDKEILIKVLQGLSDNYKADLNINRLIRDFKFKDGRPVFIVITIIAYPIILPVEST